MLVLFALVSRRIEKETVVAIDTAQQTPQDYTGKAVGEQKALQPPERIGMLV